jgi:hypothetical protein
VRLLMDRLCALVPKPRKDLVTYHGVLAPPAGLRSRVVPRREEADMCYPLPETSSPTKAANWTLAP